MSWGPFYEKNFLEKKSHNAEKTERVDPLWGFQHPFCRKTAKKIEGGPFGEYFFPEKKSHNAEKNKKGGPFGLARYGMLRGKTGKTFLVRLARPNGAIWCNNIL